MSKQERPFHIDDNKLEEIWDFVQGVLWQENIAREEVEDFCRSICDAADTSPTLLPAAYDIETFEDDHELRQPIKIIGIAKNGIEAIAIPFITQSGNLYWKTKTEAARAFRAVYCVLTHRSPPVGLVMA